MPGSMMVPKAAVVGYPVGHSRSPLIHNHWLSQLGLRGTYTKEQVAPEDFPGFISGLRERGFVGCNVTIPHKQSAFRLVRVDDLLTRLVGAVNTVFIADRQIVGVNTDVYGFTANLAHRLPGFALAGKSVLLLGAGGAARAVAVALVAEHVGRLMISNRTGERAAQLCQILGTPAEAAPWQAAESLLAETDLLINTTSLGMRGQPALDLSLARLPQGAAVCDIVYVPLETALLRRAREHGHAAVDGLGMLLHQAQPGFAKWFGAVPEVTAELRRLVEDDITRELDAHADSS